MSSLWWWMEPICIYWADLRGRAHHVKSIFKWGDVDGIFCRSVRSEVSLLSFRGLTGERGQMWQEYAPFVLTVTRMYRAQGRWGSDTTCLYTPPIRPVVTSVEDPVGWGIQQQDDGNQSGFPCWKPDPWHARAVMWSCCACAQHKWFLRSLKSPLTHWIKWININLYQYIQFIKVQNP